MHINTFDSPNSINHTNYQFYLKNLGWSVKINDFGLSRIDDKNKSFIGIQTVLMPSNFGKFSHSVDYLTLLGCIFYPEFDVLKLIYNDSFKNLILKAKSIANDNVFLNIASNAGFTGRYRVTFFVYSLVAPDLFNPTMPEDKMKYNLNSLYKYRNYYRPDLNFVYKNLSKFLPPDKVLINLIPILVNRGLSTGLNTNIDNISSPGDINNYRNYNPIFNNFPYKREYVDKRNFPTITENYKIDIVPNVITYSFNYWQLVRQKNLFII